MLALNRLILITSNAEPKLGSFIEYQPQDSSIAHRLGGSPDIKGIYVGHWVAWDGKANKKGYKLSKIKSITKVLPKLNETPHVAHINKQLETQGWVGRWLKEREKTAKFKPLKDKFKDLLSHFATQTFDSDTSLRMILKPSTYKQALSLLEGKFKVETEHMKDISNLTQDGLADADVAYISSPDMRQAQCTAILKSVVDHATKETKVEFSLMSRGF